MPMNSLSTSLREATSGLIRNNAPLVQLLGLCPVLGASTSLVNGIALGVMTAVVMVLGSTAMSLLRHTLLPAIRIPFYLLLLAVLVTSLELLTHAVFYELHEALGIFIPLIVVNCALVAHVETVASRRSVGFVFVSALANGFGLLLALMSLGALRELLGRGTLLGSLELLMGTGGEAYGLELPFDGMLVAILPPGAFFGMALLLALRNRAAASSVRADETAPALPDAPR
jgi:electron transport complex protein RnfE